MAVTYAAAIPSLLKKFNLLETPTKKSEHLQETVAKLANTLELLEEELDYRKDALPFLKHETAELREIVARLSDERHHIRAASRLLPAEIKQLEQQASEGLRIIQDIIRNAEPQKRKWDEDTEIVEDTEMVENTEMVEDTEMLEEAEMVNQEFDAGYDPEKNPKKRRHAKMSASKLSMR